MKPTLTRARARTIVDALRERWGEWLRPSELLTVSAEADGEEVHASVIVAAPDRTSELRLEARLERATQPDADVEEATWLLLDALDAWLGQVLESERLDRPPLDWTVTGWEGATLQVRGAVRDPRAEQAADALLDRMSHRPSASQPRGGEACGPGVDEPPEGLYEDDESE